MNNEELIVGTSKFGPKFQKATWHKLEPGNNYFRILPPLFSLAAEGRYYAYWAFHGGFKNSEGVTQMFRCVEATTGRGKDKLVTQHCPVCDEVTQLMARYNQLKSASESGQADPKAVQEFWNQGIFPIRVQKSFFVNAIDQNGVVGILALPYKLFQAFEEACKNAIKTYQIDPTGTEGAWLNFKKVQAFRGSKDVSYGAELALEQTANGLNFKRHTLTPSFIQETVKIAARDLKTLFREITPIEVAQLVSVPRAQVGPIVDRIFSKKEVNVATSPLTVQVPGTQATLVGRVEVAQDGTLNPIMPTMPTPAPVVTPNPNGFGTGNPNFPTVGPATAPFVPPPQVGGTGFNNGMSSSVIAPPPVVAPNPNGFGTGNPNGFGGGTVAPTTTPVPQVSGISPEDFRKVFGG